MNRGEIWLINLDPTVGSEIKKTRPAIIVNDDDIGILPLKVIVPVTDWKDRYSVAPWMVKIEADLDNGITKDSAVDTFQVRSVDEKRFIKKLGRLPDDVIRQITQALALVLSIEMK